MSFQYIHRVDWDFDPVPDSEIIACCMWEYARESKTIAMAADHYWCLIEEMDNRELFKKDAEKKAEYETKAAPIRARAKANGFDYDVFEEKFRASDLSSVGIYEMVVERARDDIAPWRAQRKAFRRYMVGQVSDSYILSSLSPAFVGHLEDLWNANKAELEKIRSTTQLYDDIEDGALWTDSEPITLKPEREGQESRKVAAAFTIDFANFTDTEIQIQFRHWLATNRPKEWKRPMRVFPDSKRRGRKLTEYRVALERLGLMRLLHWYPPAELRRKHPQAWAKYGRKKADFRREVHEACKFFKKLFPFLPREERPHSEERHGVWFPEMMKRCDEIDREIGITPRA